MARTTLLLLCLLCSLTAFGQHLVKGKVTDVQGWALPGVAVREIGTGIGTVTNIEGEFSLEVSDKTAVLSFSFIGYRTKEITLQGQSMLEVALREDCTRCFFDGHDVQLSLRSGVLKTPLGGQLQVNVPAFYRQMVLQTEATYQTNLAQNKYLKAGLELKHILVACEYEADLAFEHREIQWGADSGFRGFTLEGRFNYYRPLLFPRHTLLVLGWGKSDMQYQEGVYDKGNGGYLVGVGTTIGRPLHLEVWGKTTYWGNFWEFQGAVIREFKRVTLSAEYIKLDDFSELSLGFGFHFRY